ncbi:hypothetical protein [Xenorhabdus sp. PB30.3]|uniref:hypothetical protein n=1 Tax=Xenorhabdus sp. PB30.3 TaxID=2788941 RepID=UPI001E5F53A2|nr:hypothetical protein [Xenorhabdus sp. PB30.3]MCC8378640.1 hypothetical protein [Xenorhabdus sp. PB30.3]
MFKPFLLTYSVISSFGIRDADEKAAAIRKKIEATFSQNPSIQESEKIKDIETAIVGEIDVIGNDLLKKEDYVKLIITNIFKETMEEAKATNKHVTINCIIMVQGLREALDFTI